MVRLLSSAFALLLWTVVFPESCQLIQWHGDFVLLCEFVLLLLLLLMLPIPSRSNRPALSLVELIIFLALFAVAGGAIFSIFFTMNDQRVQQETASSVERTGLQILQTLTARIASAERILNPALGGSGTVLALQVSQQTEDPVVIALLSGSIVVVSHATLSQIGADATVSNFIVRNISPAANRPSVRISFDVTKAFPLIAPPRYYVRHFDTIVPLFPDDAPTGGMCGCDPPACSAGIFHWHVCENSVCSDAPVTVPCR